MGTSEVQLYQDAGFCLDFRVFLSVFGLTFTNVLNSLLILLGSSTWFPFEHI